MRYVVDFESNRRYVGSAVLKRRVDVGDMVRWRGQTWRVVSRAGHLVRARLTYQEAA